MLQKNGIAPDELPEIWNILKSDIIVDIHKEYLNAGCNIIKTNTFGANKLKLKKTEYTVNQIVENTVHLPKKTIGNDDAFVALDIGPTGKLLKPLGDLDFEDAIDIFAGTVIAGTKAGADLILIETMSDTYEMKAAMLAAKENSNLPIVVTFTPDETGRLLTGGDILTAVCLIESLGADALGFNCGLGPSQIKLLLPELLKYTSIPIVINPNVGIPEIDEA